MSLIHGMTIPQLFSGAVESYPENKAVVYEADSWTYAEAGEVVMRLARGLRSLGLTNGSMVGLLGRDNPHTFFMYMAIEKIGAVTVFFNSSWHENEIRSQAEKIGINILIADEAFADKTKDLAVKVYLMNRDNLTALETAGLSYAGQLPDKPITDSDPDVILFTSGSTGCPNGVLTTHFSRTNSAYAQAEMQKLTAEDIACVCIPMFHCFSLSSNILAPLTCGAAICFPKDRHTANILKCVENNRCTVLTAVPTLYSALLANSDLKKYNLSSLRVGLVGGAGCADAMLLRIQRELGIKLIPSLGQTEATSGITGSHYDDSDEEKMGTVGYILPDIEWKVEPNGEICIRGYNVMQCYYNNPELTAKTIDKDGFLHTGDAGTVDENGKVCLFGRIKEIIIRGGENISPAELECILLADERIVCAKVIGVPDDHYGEEVCACVQLRHGENMTEDEVRTLIAAEVAYYKIPKYVVFLEEMPLVGNNKVDVQTLKKMVENSIK